MHHLHRLRLVLPFVISLSCVANAAYADLRCNTRLVMTGDSMDEVLDKCGEPKRIFNKSIVTRQAHQGNRYYHESIAEQISVDVWVYKPGKGQFSRSVVFAAGEVIDIKRGERVN